MKQVQCLSIVAGCLLGTAAVSAAPGLPGLSGQAAEASTIVHFKLSGPLLERPMGDAMFLTFEPPVTLEDLVRRMKAARDDTAVKAVALTLDNPRMGLAQLQELRQALLQLRAANKDVYIHADELDTGLYALACAASRLYVVPNGEVWVMGFHSETPYLRGLLDKIGVLPEFIQMGDYKSAAESITRTGPSKEADEMMNWLLDDLYESLVSMIAESRGMTPEKARQVIDGGPYTAEEALQAGLIDAIKHRQDFLAELKERYGAGAKIVHRYGRDKTPEIDFSNPFGALMKLVDELTKRTTASTKSAIAVVYVDGPIMVGEEEPNPFFAGAEARSTTIRKALDEAAADASIKAVVLRVDSPGGSALASDIIWDATQRVRKAKPLVVSMGNVAGSGGYYVSCGAETIFADPTTITASIGVIGGKFVTTGMWNKLGVSWHERQRGANADLLNTSRPFADKDRKKITEWMESVYRTFKGRVTEGRANKLTKPIDEIASGRVFTGKQALELGLVDKLGTLSDAIAFAAAQAKISDYETRVLPEPKKLMDIIVEAFGGGKEEDDFTLDTRSASRWSLLAQDAPLLQTLLPLVSELEPLRARALLTALTRLQLIHEEGAVMMMPFELVVH